MTRFRKNYKSYKAPKMKFKPLFRAVCRTNYQVVLIAMMDTEQDYFYQNLMKKYREWFRMLNIEHKYFARILGKILSCLYSDIHWFRKCELIKNYVKYDIQKLIDEDQ